VRADALRVEARVGSFRFGQSRPYFAVSLPEE
jgi:hypothetical protein